MPSFFLLQLSFYLPTFLLPLPLFFFLFHLPSLSSNLASFHLSSSLLLFLQTFFFSQLISLSFHLSFYFNISSSFFHFPPAFFLFSPFLILFPPFFFLFPPALFLFPAFLFTPSLFFFQSSFALFINLHPVFFFASLHPSSSHLPYFSFDLIFCRISSFLFLSSYFLLFFLLPYLCLIPPPSNN